MRTTSERKGGPSRRAEKSSRTLSTSPSVLRGSPTPRRRNIVHPPSFSQFLPFVLGNIHSFARYRFGKPITVAPYIDEFMTDPKSAVKALTKEILLRLTKVTVNALDWSVVAPHCSDRILMDCAFYRDTLNAATMARKILWVGEKKVPLERFRDLEQTLVNIFSNPSPSPQLSALKTLLLAYQSTLQTTKLTHYTLSSVSLPSTLDPSIPHPLPSRFRALRSIILLTISSALRLPFFIIPFIVHLPIYVISKYSLRISKKEEDISQNKIMLGLILAVVTYSTLFVTAWMMLFLTPVGAFFAFGFTWLFVVYHNSIIDDNCSFSHPPILESH